MSGDQERGVRGGRRLTWVADLDALLSTPLDEIRAGEIVRDLLNRGDAPPVEVARFGSSI